MPFTSFPIPATLDRPEQEGVSTMERDRVGPLLVRLVERLSDHPAIVFSRSGEVLLRTRSAAVLLAEHRLTEVGVTPGSGLRRYQHTLLGELELHRHVLVDPDEHQVLLFFTTVPGSASDEKLRRLM
ncbi:MmyB family transcriptional regulator [Paractinoplanes atraurantiacus]|uniref:MmyB-like transcription regulator ligand binding domain-containing protein n=1 Tax=Paractinoplanes atraurantiacus TaxID=1036182 RepID=A0A285GQ23_9ACTN|nr:hypothetical protein [Actinoplanes atraurantiacus]SNY25314.1 hypothetical protein SAMN05421748_102314 [Actinoplanes atraurantiacus]